MSARCTPTCPPVPASARRSLESLYKTHAPDAYNLADRGYVTQIHPLELWVVKTLRDAPRPTLKALYDQGADARREVYNWLFKTSRKNAQDIRIQSLLEVEAFDGLLRDWKRLGYPFDNITPSYATAIGASGDRPAALAELMGILVNDGVRAPTVSLTGMHFAANTPYDTRLSLKPAKGERLIPVEVAQTVRRALARVVEGGTAGRLAGALKDPAGQPITMGGKTGTGDHRFETYGKGGQLIDSRVVSRSATFVFYLGDRYFGTLTAVVEGEQAGQYGFTSSLTAQMLKTLLPQLQPHLYPESAVHTETRARNCTCARSATGPCCAARTGEGKARRHHQPGRPGGQATARPRAASRRTSNPTWCCRFRSRPRRRPPIHRPQPRRHDTGLVHAISRDSTECTAPAACLGQRSSRSIAAGGGFADGMRGECTSPEQSESPAGMRCKAAFAENGPGRLMPGVPAWTNYPPCRCCSRIP